MTKALYHGKCGDIRVPAPDGSWTYCHCGGAAARWEKPKEGVFQAACLDPMDRFYTRIIGMDNRFISADLMRTIPYTNEQWRDLHGAEIRDPALAGYLFHESRRACPFVVIAPGESNDTSWVAWPGAASPLGSEPLA